MRRSAYRTPRPKLLRKKKAEKAKPAQAEKLREQADQITQQADIKVTDLEDRAAAAVAPIVQADTARVAGAHVSRGLGIHGHRFIEDKRAVQNGR